MNVAVILSAGSGTRFGSNVPKQFINLAGKYIIEYTLEQFQISSYIDEICIVANSEYHDELFSLAKRCGFEKVQMIISGGKERFDSSFKAIEAYEDKEDVNLIFHDAVRPFVSSRIIEDVVKSLENYDAIDVAIDTADTIIKIDENTNYIDNIPKRSLLKRGQTPQAFKLKTIKEAHILARQDSSKIEATDDCGLVKKYLPSTNIYVVKGEEKNIKITFPEDLLFAEKLIQFNSSEVNVDEDIFSKLENKVFVIYGGNSGIGESIKDIAKSYGAKIVVFSRKDSINIENNETIKKSLESVYKEFGKIDCVINCAAILVKKYLKDMHSSDIVNSINTNLLGSVNIAKESYKYLKETQGSVVLFSSSSYTRGREEYSLYSATKAAVVNFAQAIACEWQEEKIKINVINPARTKTPMREKHFGIEPDGSLLDVKTVAYKTLETVLSEYSGLVVDIKKNVNE